MTDYLEKLLQGSGEVLEEARRRLEELLSPLPSTALTQNQEERNAAPPQSGRRSGSAPAFQAGEMLALELPLPGNEGASPTAAERTVAEEAPGLPLLGEVQALETRRAGVGAGLPGGTRDRRAWADLSGLGSRNVSGSGPLSMPAGLGGQLPGGGTVQSAGQSWAEEVDRTFRRDSRRYDGGFFLY